jgi:hypothetical protein
MNIQLKTEYVDREVAHACRAAHVPQPDEPLIRKFWVLVRLVRRSGLVMFAYVEVKPHRFAGNKWVWCLVLLIE